MFFRFVDDHTILAYDFDELCDSIAWYEKLIIQEGLGAKINTEKYDSESLSSTVGGRDFTITGEGFCRLNPQLARKAILETYLALK